MTKQEVMKINKIVRTLPGICFQNQWNRNSRSVSKFWILSIFVHNYYTYISPSLCNLSADRSVHVHNHRNSNENLKTGLHTKFQVNRHIADLLRDFNDSWCIVPQNHSWLKSWNCKKLLSEEPKSIPDDTIATDGHTQK